MRTKRLTAGAGLVVSVLLAAADLRAQAARSDVDERAGEPTDRMIVRGVRPGRVDPIPWASTDVLWSDDFTAEGKDLADLLAETEGVFVRRFGGPGDRAEISIRGSSPNQVAVTIDGIRADSTLTGGLDLSRVCLPMIERVELTRGAGSVQEGSGAVGGAVNLVTRSASSEPVTRARIAGGAFETVEGSLLHGDRVGPVDYSVGYCGFRTEGDFEFARPSFRVDGRRADFVPNRATRENNDREQHGGSLGLGVPFAGGSLRFSDFVVYGSGGEPGIDGGNGPDAGQRLFARSRDFSNLAQLRFEGPSPTGRGDAFSLALFHRAERSVFRDPAPALGPPIDVETRLTSVGLRAADAWRAGTQVAGLAIESETTLRFDAVHDRVRASDRAGRDRPRVGGGLTEHLTTWQGRLQLSGGARIDWTDGFGAEALPSAGLVLEPAPWLRLRGQAERAYRTPSFDELFHPDEGFLRGNPALDPEEAWNFDVGAEVALAEVGPLSAVRLGFGLFRREIRDSIVWIRINDRTLQPVNTGRATSEGLELSLAFEWTRWLGFSANHTELDSRQDANGERLPGQPRRETFVRLRLGLADRAKLVAELAHTDEIFVSLGGTTRLPARTLLDLGAALELKALGVPGLPGAVSELWVHFDVDNVTDQAVRDSISFPRPGRRLEAGVEVRF